MVFFWTEQVFIKHIFGLNKRCKKLLKVKVGSVQLTDEIKILSPTESSRTEPTLKQFFYFDYQQPTTES
jgi:hypothetical protein